MRVWKDLSAMEVTGAFCFSGGRQLSSCPGAEENWEGVIPSYFLNSWLEILRVVAQADLCGNIRHLHLRKMSEQFTGALHAQVS